MKRFSNSAFEDVERMDYNEFMRVVKMNKPYRGTDAYPVGSRRYSHRHFIVVDGVVQVWHAYLKRAHEFRGGKLDKNSNWVSSRRLVSIHPDNTVEFHNVHGIGDSMYLSRLLGGGICSESKRGGIVWHKNLGGDLKTHPVFKGLRVSLTDHSLHPESQYKMIYRRVIPKEKKRILGGIRKQAEIAKVMLDAMRIEDIVAMWKEMRLAYDHEDMRLQKLEEAIANNHCVDMVVFMTLFKRSSWWIEYAASVEVATARIEDMFDRGMDFYLSHQKEAFSYIEREPFDFPSATWGITIKVGDKFAERL